MENWPGRVRSMWPGKLLSEAPSQPRQLDIRRRRKPPCSRGRLTRPKLRITQVTDAVHQNGMEYSVNEPVTATTYNPVPVRHYSVPTAHQDRTMQRGAAAANRFDCENLGCADASVRHPGQQSGEHCAWTPIGRYICRSGWFKHRVPGRFGHGGM